MPDGDIFYVGSDVDDGRLLYYSAAADVDEEITILKSLMHRYGSALITLVGLFVLFGEP